MFVLHQRSATNVGNCKVINPLQHVNFKIYKSMPPKTKIQRNAQELKP
jgi:hypothetical protein